MFVSSSTPVTAATSRQGAKGSGRFSIYAIGWLGHLLNILGVGTSPVEVIRHMDAVTANIPKETTHVVTEMEMLRVCLDLMVDDSRKDMYPLVMQVRLYATRTTTALNIANITADSYTILTNVPLPSLPPFPSLPYVSYGVMLFAAVVAPIPIVQVFLDWLLVGHLLHADVPQLLSAAAKVLS